MHQKDEKTREAWVDCLKFLGILAIYAGHYSDAVGALHPFFYSYHVPLFFLVSGFFYRPPATLQELPGFFLSKFRRLMIPYFFFESLLILKSAVFHHTAPELLSALYEGLLGRRNHVLSEWFITGLFSVIVLYTLLCCLLRNKYLAVAAALLLHLFYPQILTALHTAPNSWLWNMDSAIDYTVYFTVGHCVFPQLKTLFWQKNANRKNILVSLCFAASLAVTAIVYHCGADFISELLALPALISRCQRFLQTLLLILFQIFLARFLVSVPLLQRFGRNTLVFCGCEYLTNPSLEFLLAKCGLPLSLETPVHAVLWCFLCLCISYVTFACFLNRFFPIATGRSMSQRSRLYFDC